MYYITTTEYLSGLQQNRDVNILQKNRINYVKYPYRTNIVGLCDVAAFSAVRTYMSTRKTYAVGCSSYYPCDIGGAAL